MFSQVFVHGLGGGGVISLPVSGPMVHPGVWGCGLYWDVCASSRGRGGDVTSCLWSHGVPWSAGGCKSDIPPPSSVPTPPRR